MRKYFDLSSYRTILMAAIVIRLIAAVFSQGYGMHDDHFLIVESSASWVDGFDYNNWLPWSEANRGGPEGHSFTYVGLNYLIFEAVKGIGIDDPKLMMLINRLIHAAFSLLIVHFGFRITEKLGNREQAINIGWLLALLWILPFLSVRNLVEITCIPFMLWGVWLLIKDEHKHRFFWAGMLLGMAVSFRYQVAVFAFGVALVYIIQKQYRAFFQFSGGTALCFVLTQGVVDFIIWGYPFAEFIRYATYNSNEGTAYIPNNNYFMYIGVLAGATLVPLGFLMLAGFVKSWKKYLLIFIPVLLFIIFHSLYPSKQERFILPVLPFFLMLGVIGYDLFKATRFIHSFKRVSWRIFWVLNIPLLLFTSFTYSKKSRVEAMYFFASIDTKDMKILQESTGLSDPSMLPKFYSKNWELSVFNRRNKEQSLSVHENYIYDYIIFCDEEDLEYRIDQYQAIYPDMERVKVCEPSMVDALLRWLNPRNRNEYIEIWKTNMSQNNVPL